jgi:ABC-type Fe3+-hydroxamate transport system substrate-binding protein
MRIAASPSRPAPQDLAGIYNDIRIIASVVNAYAAAEALITHMQQTIQQARTTPQLQTTRLL